MNTQDRDADYRPNGTDRSPRTPLSSAPTPVYRQASRTPLHSATPMPPRILISITLNAQRYTYLDIGDVLDDGSMIRRRMFSKLGIRENENQALIYEADIGDVGTGAPLSDEALSRLCRARADDLASLTFYVQTTSTYPRLPGNSTPSPITPSPSTDGPSGSDADISSPASSTFTRTHHITVEPKLYPEDQPYHAPIKDKTSESVGDVKQSEPRRRYRPLPPIPTPIEINVENHKGDLYSHPNAVKNNKSLDIFFDYASVLPAKDHQNSLQPDSTSGRRAAHSAERSPDSTPWRSPLTPPSIVVESYPDAEQKRTFKWIRGELIGKTTYGAVYLALNADNGDLMTVKQIKISPNEDKQLLTLVECLRMESKILQSLDHPNIVQYLGFEETPERANLFMEYIAGGSISSLLQTCGPLSPLATRHFIAQILSGLTYLHSRKLIHRDLKSENVLVDHDGTCKISGFVISKYTSHGLAHTALVNSVHWMAPEVVNSSSRRSGYTTKIDIWSLGCVLLEMWTGTTPWNGLEGMSVMMKLSLSKELPPLPQGLSLSLTEKDFYDHCFSLDPAERWTAAQLQQHPYLTLLPGQKFTSLQRDVFAHKDRKGRADPSSIITITNPSHIDPSQNSRNILSPLYGSISEFRRFSSVVESPSRWLDVNRNGLLGYVSNDSAFDPEDRDLCAAFIRSSAVFQRCAIYLYSKLVRGDGSRRQALLDLQMHMQAWSDWDVLTALSSYRDVENVLRSLLVNDEDDEELTKIISLDVDCICARLRIATQNTDQYRTLVYYLDHPRAQSMLNLLQSLLDLPCLDISFRSSFINALLRLSRRTGLFPESLVQSQVTLQGEDAVAAGQFGDVWRGSFRERQVAIKVLKLYMQSDVEQHLKSVSREMLIWRQLRHCNVLPFLCMHYVRNNRARIGLVSPWMENGNIQQFLRRAPDADRVSLVLDVAEGLEYLHTLQPQIVHGDLKCVNILITDTRRACLTDFGLSSASDSQALQFSSFSSNPIGGTSRWTAPELLNGTQKQSNPGSDMYSFACVCYEIFSGQIPFFEYTNDYAVVLKVIIDGQRPVRPILFYQSSLKCVDIGLDDKMWHIIEDCWQSIAEQRPSAGAVVRQLPPRTRPPPHRESALLDALSAAKIDFVSRAASCS